MLPRLRCDQFSNTPHDIEDDPLSLLRCLSRRTFVASKRATMAWEPTKENPYYIQFLSSSHHQSKLNNKTTKKIIIIIIITAVLLLSITFIIKIIDESANRDVEQIKMGNKQCILIC